MNSSLLSSNCLLLSNKISLYSSHKTCISGLFMACFCNIPLLSRFKQGLAADRVEKTEEDRIIGQVVWACCCSHHLGNIAHRQHSQRSQHHGHSERSIRINFNLSFYRCLCISRRVCRAIILFLAILLSGRLGRANWDALLARLTGWLARCLPAWQAITTCRLCYYLRA